MRTHATRRLLLGRTRALLLIALRACVRVRAARSEVLVGVPKEHQDEAAAEDPKWLVNGRYGVMQYAHPR